MLIDLRPGTEPTTQAWVLTGNQTLHPLVHGTPFQPSEPHWPGQYWGFYIEQDRQGTWPTGSCIPWKKHNMQMNKDTYR